VTGRRRRLDNLDLLAADPTTPEQDVSRWATVTAINPLRVKLDGESTALPFTPESVESGLAVGARVRVQLVTNDNPSRSGRRVIVLGVVGKSFTARISTEANNNTTTLTNDPVLLFTPPFAGARWDIEIWGAYSTTAVANFKCCFDVNTGVGNGMRWTLVAPSLADTTKPPFDYRFDNAVQTLGRFGQYNPMHIRGVYQATTTATLHFQWAQNTADAGPTFILKETFIRATMLP
jgi:hypothetical protein